MTDTKIWKRGKTRDMRKMTGACRKGKNEGREEESRIVK